MPAQRAMPTEFNDSSFAVRRPHFVVTGDEARFMASRRPHRLLDPTERLVWSGIARPQTLAHLRSMVGEGAAAAVQSLWLAEMIELVEPHCEDTRRRVLVIEPHADDAALSLGGTMWQARKTCHFTVATVASRSNFTSYYYLDRDYFDTEVISSLRRAESELFAQMVGGDHVHLDLTDAPLRYRDANWSLEFFRRHRHAIAVSTSRVAEPVVHQRWIERIESLLRSHPFEEIWMPLGGPHADHRLTVNACLTVMINNPSLMTGRVVKFYQEVPYSARFPEYTPAALEALHRNGVELKLEEVDISASFEYKLRLISVYASQFKIGVMERDIQASGRRLDGADEGVVERMWTVLSLPTRSDQLGLSPMTSDECHEASSLRSWLDRHSQSRRIRIVLQIPAGRWDRDLGFLRDALPQAEFEVIASREASEEVSCTTTERVRLRTVGRGGLAWFMLAMKLAILGGVPTLFLVSNKKRREARMMAMILARSDVLILTSMDRLHCNARSASGES
jgi:LmbE family N-acetylglucosaminyl deacetylase